MSVDFSVYTIDQIAPLLDRNGIIDAVRDALIKHSRGQVQSPMPGQLVFDVVQGDCHIKFGHIADSPRFAVKIATDFSQNAARGLPNANGLSMLFDVAGVRPGMLFVAIGADAAEKQELPAALLSLADHILTDDHRQSLALGISARRSRRAESRPIATFRSAPCLKVPPPSSGNRAMFASSI